MILVAFASLLCGLASAQEGRKTIVLVFPIKVSGIAITDAQRVQLKDYLGTRLTLEGVYSVMPESQVKASLGAAKIESYQDCYDESCRIDMTKTVYADKSLSVDINSEGSTCRITAVLYDIAQEATESAADVETACGFKEIKSSMVAVAAQLSRKAGPVPGSVAPAVVGGGSVKHGVQIDRGETIVNAMTDKTGLVFIETDPPKAALMINGKSYGIAPYQDELMVGRYIVSATLNSYYHDAAQEIQLTTEGAKVKLTLSPAFGTLKVTSTPDGSEVLIDDKPVGRTPYADERLKSGQYQVEVRRDLYAPVRKTVTVSDGKVTAETFNLAADFGGLNVNSTPPGAMITIDGNATGKATPALFPQLATGLHIVTVDLEGYGRQVENVRIAAGSSERLDLKLSPKMGRLTVMTVDESGAPCVGTLSIDGSPVGQTPWKGDLIAVSHKVEARCGDGAKSETVTVEHNAQKSLKLQMEPSKGGRWVRLPGGTFQMGSKKGDGDETPIHSVTLSSFEMSATEVTVAQYGKCVVEGVCSAPHWDDKTCFIWEGDDWKQGVLPKEFRGDDVPVVCVDWDQAAAYANWVGGRLPTEAEWEYAASSGGQIKEYPWGAKAATCEKAVMRDELFQKKSKSPKPDGCGLNRPWPVCSKLSGNTVQGLCDMAGNVWEWVSDWYWISGPAGIFEWPYGYSSKAQTNPTGPSSGTYRVIRGGAWNNDSFNLRINKRESVHPGRKSNAVGIRVVR